VKNHPLIQGNHGKSMFKMVALINIGSFLDLPPIDVLDDDVKMVNMSG